MAEKDTKKAAPPYVAFKTFWNFLDKLGQIGTPPRIDRSVWGDGLSGAYGSQLMAALRFLELIDEDGYVSPDMKAVAEDTGLRKDYLRESIPRLYAPVLSEFSVDLSEATPAQLDEAFKEMYDISGATKTKAIAFLVGAAKAAELPLSGYIERKTRQRSTSSKKRKPRAKEDTNGSKQDTDQTSSGSDVPERIVTLKSGGTIRLSLDYNPFKVSAADRQFVNDLIDMIQKYEGGGASE